MLQRYVPHFSDGATSQYMNTKAAQNFTRHVHHSDRLQCKSQMENLHLTWQVSLRRDRGNSESSSVWGQPAAVACRVRSLLQSSFMNSLMRQLKTLTLIWVSTTDRERHKASHGALLSLGY